MLARVIMLVALVWGGVARAEEAQLQIVEFGAYTVLQEQGTTDPSFAPTGISPLTLVTDPAFVSHTDRIEAQLCRRFGILYRISESLSDPGMSGGLPVQLRITHPLIVRPDGEQAKEETWNSMATDTPSIAGFAFREPWEMAPGAWTFEVLSEGRVLASKRFEVVLARAGAAPLEGCGVPVS